jgi:hypothetical protein
MTIAPPFRLLGIHFVGAILWLLVGGAGLVAIAPELAAGGFLEPRVFAVTHAYTLGVIVASVFGALYQFYPMSLGVGARSIGVGVVGAWLLHAGVAAMVAGFWFWRPALQAVGWTFLFLAVGCVSWNLLPRRRQMSHGRRTAAYVSAAHSMLGFALLIGGARIGESLGWWAFDRLSAIAAHFHLAAFGFAGLTAVGVGGKLLPMFMVSGAGPEWPIRAIGPIGGTGLIALALGLLVDVRSLVWLGAALGVVAAALFATTVAGYFRRRLIRVLEPAFGHVLAGFISLMVALSLGVAQLVMPGVWLRGWVAYAELTVLGWLVVFITGIWYRLFTFVIWLHFYGGSGAGRVKTAAELVHAGTAWSALWLLAGGVLVLVAGTALGSRTAVSAGAGSVLGGSVLIAVQHARIFAGRKASG